MTCFLFMWTTLDFAVSSETIFLSCFSDSGNDSTYPPAWSLLWSVAYEDTNIIRATEAQTHNLDLLASFPNFIPSKSYFFSGPSSSATSYVKPSVTTGISWALLPDLPQQLQSSIWCLAFYLFLSCSWIILYNPFLSPQQIAVFHGLLVWQSQSTLNIPIPLGAHCQPFIHVFIHLFLQYRAPIIRWAWC